MIIDWCFGTIVISHLFFGTLVISGWSLRTLVMVVTGWLGLGLCCVSSCDVSWRPVSSAGQSLNKAATEDLLAALIENTAHDDVSTPNTGGFQKNAAP